MKRFYNENEFSLADHLQQQGQWKNWHNIELLKQNNASYFEKADQIRKTHAPNQIDQQLVWITIFVLEILLKKQSEFSLVPDIARTFRFYISLQT